MPSLRQTNLHCRAVRARLAPSELPNPKVEEYILSLLMVFVVATSWKALSLLSVAYNESIINVCVGFGLTTVTQDCSMTQKKHKQSYNNFTGKVSVQWWALSHFPQGSTTKPLNSKNGGKNSGYWASGALPGTTTALEGIPSAPTRSTAGAWWLQLLDPPPRRHGAPDAITSAGSSGGATGARNPLPSRCRR